MAAKNPILGLKTAFIWCIFGIERVNNILISLKRNKIKHNIQTTLQRKKQVGFSVLWKR